MAEDYVVQLGSLVIASHPAGHRLVGTVRGIGSHGFILAIEGMRVAPFLDRADGWVLEAAADCEPRWEIIDTHRCTVCGHTDGHGWRMTEHLRTHARPAASDGSHAHG